MEILYTISFTGDEWADIIGRVHTILRGSTATNELRRQVTYTKEDGIVKFLVSGDVVALEAIALALYGYSILNGNEPSRELLLRTLSQSRQTLSQDVLNSRLADLRNKQWLQSKALVLSAKARKELSKKYII